MAIATPPRPPQNWVVDSGASHHLTTDLNNLALHSEYNGTKKVTIGNGKTLPISHIGSSVMSASNSRLIFKDILCVPNVVNNLLSVHSITKNNSVLVEFFADFLEEGFEHRDNYVSRGE